MKYRHIIFASVATLSLIGCSPENATQRNIGLDVKMNEGSSKTTHEEFEACLGEFKERLYLLGRGEDYPAFILDDIKVELIKQDPESKLISAKCLSEVQLAASFLNVLVDDEEQRSLEVLSATFPLEIVVFNGEENWILDVSLEYFVEGLISKTTPTLTKKFIVNESYDENREVLKKLQFTIKD